MASLEQTYHPDGRVELTDPAAIVDSPYGNAELAPTRISERRWTTYNYAALWMGMAHNIPSYLLAAGLVALGMNWLQAFLTITLGNLIVLVPLLLNSHAGTKYGTESSSVGGHPWTMWLSFAFFWALQMWLIWRGIEGLRRFENWAAPLVTLAFLALMIGILVKAGGFGPILSQPSKLGWDADFWKIFAPSLMGMIAFWATLSLNMPDFTRFGKGQRQQVIGQIIGLPTTMSFIALVSIITTSGTVIVYGTAIWDPVELTRRFENPVVVTIGLVMAILATMSCNVAANVVSPSYDFANALPRWLNFRTAGLLTGVIGVVIQPWRLIADPEIYIFVWLSFYGGLLASVAGVLIAGYWFIDRTNLHLADLYLPNSRYWYSGGWNWRAVVATLFGSLLAVGGAYSNPGAGPFPENGLIPFLQPLYDYSWIVGLVVGFLAYLALTLASPIRHPAPTHATSTF